MGRQQQGGPAVCFEFCHSASFVDFRESSRAKFQFLKKKFKSQNLAQFLRLGSEFLHVISISIEFQTLNSSMLSQSTPLLIS